MIRVRRVWGSQVAAEYAAAARSAHLCHWLFVLGASPDTLLRANRVVTDELTHADLSREVYDLAGGDPAALPVDSERLQIVGAPEAALPMRTLAAVAELFCCSESAAESIFEEVHAHASQPRVVQVLERLVRDEHFHRIFSWDVLDELLELTGDPGREFLRPRIPGYVRDMIDGYDFGPGPVTPEQRAWGLVDRERYVEVVRERMERDVLPRFAERGLA